MGSVYYVTGSDKKFPANTKQEKAYHAAAERPFPNRVFAYENDDPTYKVTLLLEKWDGDGPIYSIILSKGSVRAGKLMYEHKENTETPYDCGTVPYEL